MQCLGWLDGELLATQLPKLVPKFVTSFLGARAYGFFVTIEDGSSPDNRILANRGPGELPTLTRKFLIKGPTVRELIQDNLAFFYSSIWSGYSGPLAVFLP